MAEFKAANDLTRAYEGYYANVEGDKGGETYAGISRVNYPRWQGWAIIDAHKPLRNGEKIDSSDLESLLNSFYFLDFWQRIRGNEIDSQAVASYTHDWHVNSGSHAVKAAQTIVGAVPDGMVGTSTIQAINSYSGDLLTELHNARKAFYNRIVAEDPSQEKFLKGWMDRADSIYSKLQNT